MRYLALVGVLLLSGCVTDDQGTRGPADALIRSVCGLRWLSAKEKQPLPHRASTLKAEEWWAWPGP
jgi:hypothetical protein